MAKYLPSCLLSNKIDGDFKDGLSRIKLEEFPMLNFEYFMRFTYEWQPKDLINTKFLFNLVIFFISLFIISKFWSELGEVIMKRNFLNCASVFKRTDTFFFFERRNTQGMIED